MDYINSESLSRLRQEYKIGKVVRAVKVFGIEEGVQGIVKKVRSNGSITVQWNLGYETDVIWGQESIAVVTDGTCILDYNSTNGGCDGDRCCECGWNVDVAEKRIKCIKNGGMVVNKNGIMSLKVRKRKGKWEKKLL